VLVAPAAIITTGWTEWSEVLGSRPVRAVDQSADASFEFAGAEWRVVEAARGRPQRPEGVLPEGAELIVAQVEVTPDAELAGCAVHLVESATGRTFVNDESLGVWNASDGTTTACDPAETGSYVLEFPFMVPADTGDVELVISVVAELPDFVRVPLEIEPRQ
jgi:hypothetical protein